jgi:oligopeptide/dipeptide ABC transporter ATP-binding protein
MEKKLEVKNLVLSFRTQAGKVQAVRDISFDLYKGETLSIVGESGSGKSVTSRAIMGILAGNAIVEGGEIIYDGQDLLKISEDDMHKLRGDKIAMIFQDPMSSLNPIMKVGGQLTEAMLLKNASSMNNARDIFNEKLRLLLKNVNEVTPDSQHAANAEISKTFDEFCIESLKLEGNYNEIYRHAVELQVDIDDLLFLVEKKQKVDVKARLKLILKAIGETLHQDIVVMDERLTAIVAELNTVMQNTGKGATLSEGSVALLKELDDILETSINKEKPNYFTLGYYMYKNPGSKELEDLPVAELNKLTHDYLEQNFMNQFIAFGEKGIQNSHDVSMKRKVELLGKTEETLEYFRGDNLERKVAVEKAKEVAELVNVAIDRLAILKNSVEYMFRENILIFIDKFFDAVKRNPIEQRRYDRQVEKRDAAIAKGKIVDWEIVPAVLVDLELAKKNIRDVLHALRASIRSDIEKEPNFNANAEMERMVDYLKEQASAAVYKVTPKMAKARALKLLEEVGIPEPAIRYNQYPFEFSGGMRQRIVIAIALAANPDILICDEPTTALDVTIQSQILELINNLKRERNLSVIFITHNLGVVANMADRIAVMYAGKIVEIGAADDIFYDPRHPYTWALLSSMPDLETKEKLEAIPGTPPNMIFPPVGDAFAARNKFALEIDFEEQPPLFEVKEGHYAATWLLHPDAPAVEPPRIVTDRIERMTKGAK